MLPSPGSGEAVGQTSFRRGGTGPIIPVVPTRFRCLNAALFSRVNLPYSHQAGTSRGAVTELTVMIRGNNLGKEGSHLKEPASMRKILM